MQNIIAEISEIIQNSHQTDISFYDGSFLEKTIRNRLFLLKIETPRDYLRYFKLNKNEISVLTESLHINYSEFFRNPLTFAFIEQIVIPKLIDKKLKGKEKEIRIWSAACAAGQEPYSLAILLDEYLKKKEIDVRYRIFATDICPNEIDRAKKGLYNDLSIGKVSYHRIKKYFTIKGNEYQIDTKLKTNIDFSVFDLLSEQGTCPPESIFGNFDIVFCSNVLFYYKPECRKIIIERFENCLAKDSYVITGEAEREILRTNNYEEISINSAIFKSVKTRG